MKSGYLYIVTNDVFPGWIKVGSTWNLKDRLKTYQTGDPFRRYTLRYSLFHPLFREAEKKIKESMKRFAKNIKNEWYECDFSVARVRLEETLLDYEDGLYNTQPLHDLSSPRNNLQIPER